MIYSKQIKNERMNVVKNHIDGCVLKIYTSGYEKLIVEIKLLNPSSVVSGDKLKIIGIPLMGTAIADGKAKIAKITDNLGAMKIKDIMIGTKNTNIIIDNDDIKIGQIVKLNSGIIIHG